MTKQVFQISFTGKTFMIFLIFRFFISNLYAQDVYYIDPDFTGSGRNGSAERPFNSFNDFQWQAGGTYLLKSSSSVDASATIDIAADNVTFSSYGTGNRPVINSKVINGTRVMVVRGRNVKVSNLDIRALNNGPDNSAGCIIDMIGAANPTLDNCKTTGGNRGINASKTTGTATIINCHITDTWDDGMYNRINETVIIENTLVERVNLKYHINPDQTYAGGDCIQFDYVDHFEIRNCTLDKTYTGGKFCLIADHFGTGITEKSTFKGATRQHGVYLGIGQHYIFRYNNLSGCQYGVWNKTVDVELYYNVLKNTALAAYYGNSQASGKVWNNLFISCGEAVSGWNETMQVNNNIFYNNKKNINGNFSKISASNNCYYPGQPSSSETNSFTANPLFTSLSSGEYHLSSGSPCIDAGITIDGMHKDMLDCTVPFAGKTDIGPCEYGSLSSNVNNPPVLKISSSSILKGAKIASLDASATADPDGDKLNFSWASSEGIQISGQGSPVIKFLAPDVTQTKTISFTLNVSDGKEKVSKVVSLTVEPYKPEIPRVEMISASASAHQDPNIPGHAVDGVMATRWSAEGDGNWLVAELENETLLSYLKVAYHNGSYRKGYFDIYASSDNRNWDLLLKNMSSCGFSEEKQAFDLPAGTDSKNYKYIKLVGHANSENGWNSYAEIQAFGKKASIVSPPSSDNLPPVVKLNVPSTIPAARTAVLDASASTDPEGKTLSYNWSSNSGVYIVSPASAKLKFLAPDVSLPEKISFELQVSDGENVVVKTYETEVQPYKADIPQVTSTRVSASSYQDTNVPGNAVDGNLDTRWAVDGDNHWLIAELESPVKLSHLKIAYHFGHYRAGYFDIYASADNQSWDLLIQNGATSGLSPDCEAFDIPAAKTSVSYKYLKVVGHSNSRNSWNSFSEVKIFGSEADIADESGSATEPVSSVTAATIVNLDASDYVNTFGKQFNWKSLNGIYLSSKTASRISFLAPDVNEPSNISFVLEVSDGVKTNLVNIDLEVLPYQPDKDKIAVISAEASAYQSPNYPQNAVDGNQDTRWSADGDNNWLIMELENRAFLSFFKLAYKHGHYRIGYFDILGSNDKSTWDMILQNQATSGLSQGNEAFDVPYSLSTTSYKYIKLVGHSNSENSWNSFIEVAAFGEIDYSAPEAFKKSTSIESISSSEDNSFSMYPNPSVDFLNLDFNSGPDAKVSKIRIVSINGKIVYEEAFQNGTDHLRIDHNFRDGIYIIQVSYDNATQITKKLIVNKP